MPISSPLCPVITRLHRAHPRQASGDHQRRSQLMGVLIVLIIRSGTGNPPERFLANLPARKFFFSCTSRNSRVQTPPKRPPESCDSHREISRQQWPAARVSFLAKPTFATFPD
jgi:hypothetical protein